MNVKCFAAWFRQRFQTKILKNELEAVQQVPLTVLQVYSNNRKTIISISSKLC
mgnify:CR=1 FL=1